MEKTCEICNGNDMDAPCAYPGTTDHRCLRYCRMCGGDGVVGMIQIDGSIDPEMCPDCGGCGDVIAEFRRNYPNGA